jgi:hypothetical protein
MIDGDDGTRLTKWDVAAALHNADELSDRAA